MAKGAKPKGSKVWSVMSLGTALASAAMAKKALNGSWKAATGKKPPANPADPDVNVWEAVAWATVSGTFVSVVKMLASRRAANYFLKSTGHLPPDLQADQDRVSREQDSDSPSDAHSDVGEVVGSAVE